MNNKLDHYDFSTASQSGEIGFEMFQGETDGRFFFRFNGTKGKAILFSQGYTHLKGRENGFRSVVRNALIESHFDMIYLKDGKSFQFVLFAGNKQEIARSIVFDSEKKMIAALDFFKNYIRANSPLNDNEKETMEPQKYVKCQSQKSDNPLNFALQSQLDEIQTITKEPEITDVSSTIISPPVEERELLSESSAREVFRIELYRPNKHAVVKGKIIHALSKEEALLNGLNNDTLYNFITRYFPDQEGGVTLVNSMKTHPKAHHFSPSIEHLLMDVNVEMSIQSKGYSTQVVSQYDSFDIHLFSPIIAHKVVMHAIIGVVNLETREKSIIMERQLCFLNGKNIIEMPPQMLTSGLFRFTISLSLDEVLENLTHCGTCLLQVI